MVDKNIILDLCGGSGSWSRPYKENGFRVYNITLPEFDVCNVDYYNDESIKFYGRNSIITININEVYGILAAPPCTMFSLARTKAKTPRDLKEGMKCVRACLDIIWKCNEIQQDTGKKKLPLKFWALENPNGMLKYFLGKPSFEFNPYDFGDQYQKNTHIWGWFKEPKKNPVELTQEQKTRAKTNSQTSPILKPYKSLNPKFQKKFDMMASRDIAPEMFGKLTRQERRAITPKGFADAFFKANKN